MTLTAAAAPPTYQDLHRPNADSVAMYHAARTGQFPQHFADRMIRDNRDVCLESAREHLEAFGAQLYKALAVRGDYRKAQANLQRLARRICTAHSRGIRRAVNDLLLAEVCGIKVDLWRREQGYSNDGKWPRIFGTVLATIHLCQHQGIRFDIETITALVRNQTGASETDIKNAILFHTSDANLYLSDWLNQFGRN